MFFLPTSKNEEESISKGNGERAFPQSLLTTAWLTQVSMKN